MSREPDVMGTAWRAAMLASCTRRLTKNTSWPTKNGVGPLARESREGRVDLTTGAGVQDLDLQSHGAGSRFHVSQRGLRTRSIGRIDEHSHAGGSGHQLTQEFEPLCCQLGADKIDSCQVAAGSGEA